MIIKIKELIGEVLINTKQLNYVLYIYIFLHGHLQELHSTESTINSHLNLTLEDGLIRQNILSNSVVLSGKDIFQ